MVEDGREVGGQGILGSRAEGGGWWRWVVRCGPAAKADIDRKVRFLEPDSMLHQASWWSPRPANQTLETRPVRQAEKSSAGHRLSHRRHAAVDWSDEASVAGRSGDLCLAESGGETMSFRHGHCHKDHRLLLCSVRLHSFAWPCPMWQYVYVTQHLALRPSLTITVLIPQLAPLELLVPLPLAPWLARQ
jgi:hypothetical protein